MKFTIITHAVHKQEPNGFYSYEPYVREMNIWSKYVSQIKIVAPIRYNQVSVLEERYNHDSILLSKIPSFNTLNILNKVKSIFIIPLILVKIFRAILWADHVHLRCPGNVGLLGSIVQVFFPKKFKTVKYAGNWDPKSKQPLSYRVQKWILSNTFLTRNCKVLVYGKWQNQSKNIIPFFTASYLKNEIIDIPKKDFSLLIKFIYVGSFSKGKQPLLSVKVAEELSKKYNVRLNMYGDGEEFDKINKYIEDNNLKEVIHLHGNQSKDSIKKAFKDAHFLLFISKSEGWPKVVAEAMFWRCLPISSDVSCVNYMLGNNTRGSVLKANVSENDVVSEVKRYLDNEDIYQKKVLNARNWSQKYTLEKFENEITKLL